MKRVCVLLLVAAVVWWLVADDLQTAELGPGTRLVARAGVPVYLVEEPARGWVVLTLESQGTDEGSPLPAGKGLPWIDGRGRVLTLVDGSLRRWVLDPAAGRLVDEALDLPEADHAWSLAGVDGADEPVLVGADGSDIAVRLSGSWSQLVAVDGRRPEPGSPILVSVHGRALAFRGAEGWEAWVYDDPAAPERHVAAGCVGSQAVFTPDGHALVTDGRTDGLWRVELDRRAQGHMALGNLGTSPRVPWSCGFRGDPLMLLAPQWDIQGYLQLHHTNLSGGGRWGFSTGFTQHYHPVVSGDGRSLAYVQAGFDPDGDESFEEQLFLFDFERPQSPAVPLGSRPGGRSGTGPAFVGAGSTLVWIAEGRVHRVQRSVR